VLAVLVAVLPVLGGSPTAAGELVVLTLAVALAGLAAVAWRSAGPVPALARAAANRRDDVPALRGRATDCGHHPHAPRAPGLG
jgi:hypothetical protein